MKQRIKAHYKKVNGKRVLVKAHNRNVSRHKRLTSDDPQTGKRKSIKDDRRIKAKHPGYRISASGNIYSETRRNRSDKRGTRI